jgi:hypothetical protein
VLIDMSGVRHVYALPRTLTIDLMGFMTTAVYPPAEGRLPEQVYFAESGLRWWSARRR